MASTAQLDAEIARREGGQAQASPSSFDPTMMMMEGMDAAEQHRQRQMHVSCTSNHAAEVQAEGWLVTGGPRA